MHAPLKYSFWESCVDGDVSVLARHRAAEVAPQFARKLRTASGIEQVIQ
jgi:hypothetical protein